MQAIQEKFMWWVLELNRDTPGYMLKEECKKDKMRVVAGRMLEKTECLIMQERWREKMRDGGKGI